MSRWDEIDRKDYGIQQKNDDVESHLLRKFDEYVSLEKTELEKKKFLEVNDEKKPSGLYNRYVIFSILEGIILTALIAGFFTLMTNQ